MCEVMYKAHVYTYHMRKLTHAGTHMHTNLIAYTIQANTAYIISAYGHMFTTHTL